MIAGASAPQARAQEIKEITLAQQFGAIFIPLMAMENLQLIEKQAAAQRHRRSQGQLGQDGRAVGDGGRDHLGQPALLGAGRALARADVGPHQGQRRRQGDLGHHQHRHLPQHPQPQHQVDPRFHRQGSHRRAFGEGIDPGAVPADRRREGVGPRPARQARSPDRRARASRCHCRRAQSDGRDHDPLCHLAVPRDRDEGGPQDRDQRLRDHGRCR